MKIVHWPAVALVVAGVLSAVQLCAATFTYTLSGDYATITGAKGTGTTLEIPAAIDGHPVVAIAARAFNNNYDIEEVIIPESVTNIGAYAFSTCYELERVAIPDSVTVLGSYAFYECHGLESVSIGNGVKTIGKWTFGECYGLSELSIGNAVQTIGEYAFNKCYGLETIVLPRSVQGVKWGAFSGNPVLSTVYFPDSFKGKGSAGMFENSPNVARVYYACQNPVAPPATTALSATDDGPMAVRLDWKGDASYEISCYKIYRSEGDAFEDAELIAEVMPDEEMVFFDSDVSPDPIYSYWVVAANDIFESEPAGPVFGCCEENFYIDEDAQLPVGYVGEDYAYRLKAVFDNGFLSWEIDELDYGDGRIESLPEGMTLSSDGLLSGVPAAAGTYQLWIYFYDVRFPDGEASCACLTLEVRERGKPCITGSTPEGFAPVVLWGGESRLFSVEADDFAGGNLTYSWFVDGAEVQSGAKSAYRLRTNGYKLGTVHEVACFANDDNSALEVSRRWTVKIPAGTLYVDAATGDDARDGLTKETAFASIQAAIDKAVDGDTIIVADGVYGPIETRNLYLTIESENGYKGAIIDGGGDNCCAWLCGPEAEDREYDEDGNIILPYGEWDGTNTRLCGFTLRNGRAMFGAGATGGTLEQCLIIDNVAEAVPYSASRSGAGGGAIRSVLRYCTIAGNNAIGWHDDDDNFGNGIVGEGGGACDCTLENCIVWNNIAEVDADCSRCETTGCVAGVDPLFADAANGDWRVLPQSPCVSGGIVVAGCESEIAPSVVPGELPAGALAWVAQYKDAFGSDPAVAMSKPTGKKSPGGAPLRVWHDYVAGTDPLDTNSVFTATITIVDGKPVVEWSPHLDNRVYTIYGKTNLTDKVWLSPTNSSSRFFKVEVTLPKGE